MEAVVSSIVDGLSMGSLYALLALALVFIYRSTGLLNFCQGELAMLTTYVCAALLTQLSPWLAVPGALFVSFLVGAALHAVVLREMDKQRELNGVIVTVGLLTVISGVTLWLFGPNPRAFPSPFGEGAVHLGAYALSRQSLGTLAVASGVLLGVFMVFQRTTFGLALRATSENWLAARLVGVRVERTFSMGWALASVLGTIAGMLAAPKIFLHPFMMQGMLIYAFAAAVVGGLDSPAGAVIGGLLLGILETFAGRWEPIGAELQTIVALALLILILMVRPRGLLGRAKVRKV